MTHRFRSLLGLAALLSSTDLLPGARAAILDDWPYRQSIVVASPGLCRLRPTLESYDGAQAGLADLRILDAGHVEVPYLLDRPQPARRRLRPVLDLVVTLTGGATRLQFGVTNGALVRGLQLQVPPGDFFKAVTIEAISDEGTARTVIDRRPLFRQGGVSRTAFDFNAGIPGAGQLRLTLDDARSKPIPITGLLVYEEEFPPRPPLTSPAVIEDRKEGPSETRLTLDLGAAHLPVTGLQVETSEPLFNRRVNILTRDWINGEVQERLLGGGNIFRLALDGQATVEQLEVPVEFETGREVILSIVNGDSPPLVISAARVSRADLDLVLLARTPGEYALLTGNGRVGPPVYDLAPLAGSLRGAAASRLEAGPRTASQDYRPSEPLPEVPFFGAALDPAPWKFRRPLRLSGPGVHRLELSPHALAHAQPGWGDVRLLGAGQQVLYLLEAPAFARALPVKTAKEEVKDRPRLSRWRLELPQARLPITRVRAEPKSTLFERDVRVFEEVNDPNRGRMESLLGHASWARRPGDKAGPVELMLNRAPQGSSIYVETDNGDNAPLDLGTFQVFLPVVELRFRVPSGVEVELCYGNPAAAAPRYDLSLVAPQVLAAAATEATLAATETDHSPAGSTSPPTALVLYLALALVVGGLIFIITRLLPKKPAT